MKTMDNKFEIGEEYWTYARENIKIVCPVCKGAGKFFIANMKFHANSVIQQEELQEGR